MWLLILQYQNFSSGLLELTQTKTMEKKLTKKNIVITWNKIWKKKNLKLIWFYLVNKALLLIFNSFTELK